MVAFPLDGQRDAVCRCRIGSDIRVLRNTEKQTQFDSAAEEANQSAVYGRFFSFSLLLLLLFTILYGKINYL